MSRFVWRQERRKPQPYARQNKRAIQQAFAENDEELDALVAEMNDGSDGDPFDEDYARKYNAFWEALRQSSTTELKMLDAAFPRTWEDGAYHKDTGLLMEDYFQILEAVCMQRGLWI